ncbi:methyltransferase family protein [Terasakiella sp.]|uniref:methyltransferase family protein n=1 Tax=Terasakiella sp. TaxID=2034861 RepID=UPI003AA7FB9D
MFEHHLIYGAAWLTFGLVHSLLAREFVKSRLKPLFGAFYRLAYNIFATLQIAAVYVVGLWLYEHEVAFARADWLVVGQGAVYLIGWLLMILALREYDLGTFSGLTQICDHLKGILAHDDEPLHFKGFHCWVRHPLYSAGLLILWGRVTDPFDLMTAIFGTLYLWVGARFEERHLIRLYGDHYATYKSRVPAFIPVKGKVILKEPKP